MIFPFWKRIASVSDGSADTVVKFGRTDDPTTGSTSRPMWDMAQDFTYFSSAKTLGVSSDSANDVYSTGSGAQAVRIMGQDDDGNEITEVVQLNGTTKVETENQYKIVYRAGISLPDSLTVMNDGDIYIYDTASAVTAGVPDTLSMVQAMIPAGYGQTNMCIYRVPKGYNAQIKRCWGSISARTGVYADLECFVRKDGEPFKNKWIKGLCTTGTSYFESNLPMPDVYPELTDIQLRCMSSATATISGGFDILLTKDGQ